MNDFFCRVYQKTLKFASLFLKFPQPLLLSGENSYKKLGGILVKNGKKSALVVTGNRLFESGKAGLIISALNGSQIKTVCFHGAVSNPTTENVSEAVKTYFDNNCDCIVAFGGGSPIDCAKAAGAVIASGKPIGKLAGLMKVGKKIPFFAAIPTTAGTGSEVSVAAVITDENNHRKFAINDTKLIPSVAVLDPVFLKGMPAKIIAETGMDALTHAVEAFIGKSNTKKTEENAVSAVKLIDKYLITAYNDNNNTEALYNMQIASYKAGLAFTRAYVGYVHAIAHSLGGKYNIGHGYANAVILPYVLEVYGKKAYNKLALLAEDVGSDEDRMNVKQKAESFISYIRNLNKKLGISENFGGLIKNEDIEGLVSAAMKEAVPLYPVPKIFKKEEFIQIYNNIN